MDSLTHDAHFYTIDYDPAGSVAVAAGAVVVMGTMIGVVVDLIAAGGTGVVQIRGGFTLAATVGENWVQGAQLYWNAGTAALTNTVGANAQAGRALAAKANAGTTNLVFINNNGE